MKENIEVSSGAVAPISLEGIQESLSLNQVAYRRNETSRQPGRACLMLFDSNGRTPAVSRAYGGGPLLAANVLAVVAVMAAGAKDFVFKVFSRRTSRTTGKSVFEPMFGYKSDQYHPKFESDKAMFNWLKSIMSVEPTGIFDMKIDHDDSPGAERGFSKTRKRLRSEFLRERSPEGAKEMFSDYLQLQSLSKGRPPMALLRDWFLPGSVEGGDISSGMFKDACIRTDLFCKLMVAQIASITRDQIPFLPTSFAAMAAEMSKVPAGEAGKAGADAIIEKWTSSVRTACASYGRTFLENVAPGTPEFEQRGERATKSANEMLEAVLYRTGSLDAIQAIHSCRTKSGSDYLDVLTRKDEGEGGCPKLSEEQSWDIAGRAILSVAIGSPVQIWRGKFNPRLVGSFDEIMADFDQGRE